MTDQETLTTVADQKQPTGAERRRSERRPYRVPGVVMSLNEDDPAHRTEIEADNLSLHGMGFRTTQELAVGTVFVIQMGTGRFQLNGRIRIVFCRHTDDGSYDVGAEFV